MGVTFIFIYTYISINIMSGRGVHEYSTNYTHCGLSKPLLNDNPPHQCTVSALGYGPDM